MSRHATTPFLRRVIGRLGILTAALVAARLAPDARGAEIQWALFDRACQRGTSSLEVACGNRGVYHLIHVVPPPGCEPIASGQENPPIYQVPGHMRAFPQGSGQLDPPAPEPNGEAPSPSLGTPDFTATGTEEDAGSCPADESPLMDSKAAGSLLSPPMVTQPAPQPQPVVLPWIAAIDFQGTHGSSTSWLAGAVAGSQVSVSLSFLDDPALDALGEVGDFHLLARLCGIAEAVDMGAQPPPRVVNMSFGRAVREGEARSGADCNPSSAGCQIAKTVDHLRAKGSALVASAGNQQDPLFPGSLDSVLSAGMLDVNALLNENTIRPAWETPTEAEALLPANGLCLRGWAAPSGSSYASAMLSGWLASVLVSRPGLDPTGGGIWMPSWSDTSGCYVLARGGVVYTGCNAKISELIAGLRGGNETDCWSAPPDPWERAGGLEPAVSQPGVPSFTSWASGTHATPESDPCVPCVVKLDPGDTDVTVNLYQSTLLPEGTFLHAVYLRAGDDFHLLDLTPDQLQAIEQGGLASLVLADAQSFIDFAQTLSLWYEMTDDPFNDCSAGTCFWSSTPIVLGSQ